MNFHLFLLFLFSRFLCRSPYLSDERMNFRKASIETEWIGSSDRRYANKISVSFSSSDFIIWFLFLCDNSFAAFQTIFWISPLNARQFVSHFICFVASFECFFHQHFHRRFERIKNHKVNWPELNHERIAWCFIWKKKKKKMMNKYDDKITT